MVMKSQATAVVGNKRPSSLLRLGAVAALATAVGYVGKSFVQGPGRARDAAESSRRDALQGALWGAAGGLFGLEAMDGARADGDSDRIVLPAINRMDKFRCRWQSSKMGQANAARDKLFDLRECDMRGTTAKGYDIAGVIMSDGDFSGADFDDSVMSKAVAVNSKFENATFRNSVVDRVTFQGSNLKNAIFTNSIMTGTTFPNANLENVDFTDASLNQWGMKALCGNPTMKGKNPFTGADTFESAGCDARNLMR
eukprot:TRINITY_DN15670_c0_g1_i1.p1 TRINITY_DN15670_c0_g1~~TRINITY_DN15670_c0_g1_i1.p1  ORF type:complete len:254 (-),score=67.45 TRINITY_DN15670_c0_g1_i1:227-988(-)